MIFILGLSDTSSNNSLARLADSLGAPSNPSGVHPIITNIPLETPPLPSRNVGQPPPLRPPVITSPSRQNSRYVNYGRTGCGVFKRGIQNQKDFCLINILKGNYWIMSFGLMASCQNLTFKVNFLCQKSSESFSTFFIEEYQFRSTFFVIDILW